MRTHLRNAALTVAATGLAATAFTYAAMWPPSRIFGRTLISGDDPAQAALTFDDGPNGDTTLRLLDVLAAHDARATFFLVGKFVRQQPEVVRAMAAAGHLIGNHTMTHPKLHIQTEARIREELTGCSALLEDTIGAPVRVFRPPFGARRPFVLHTARRLGLTTVLWNALGFDWDPHTPAEIAASVRKGLAQNLATGVSTNILLHDGGQDGLGQPRMPSVEATGMLLTRLKQENIRPVTVDAWF